MITNIQTLDWFVFSLVLLITFVAVIWGHRLLSQDSPQESNSVLEMLLMGRRLTLPLFIATLVATWYGGIFGVAKIAFESGIYNWITQGVFWYASYLIFAFFLFKRIKHYQAVTLPDLLDKMVGPSAKKIAAFFNIVNLVPIAYCISIGQLINMLFGTGLILGSSIGVVAVLSYSMFGGFRSVVFSDLVQFFVMVSSVILVLLFSIGTFGFAPLQSLPDSYFSPTGQYSVGETLMWGFLAMATLIDPNFYQRAFAASNDKVVTRGIVLSTVIWMVFDLSLTFGAMYARALMPDADPSQGYFQYALDLLPAGLRGYFLAGILATIASTMDSYLFLAGTTISYDLLPKRFAEKKLVHSLCIFLVASVGLLLSFYFEGNVKKVWKTTGSLLTSGLLVPVLLCYFNVNFRKEGPFLLACLSGILATLVWVTGGLESLYGIDALYPGALASLTMLVFLTKAQAVLIKK